MTIIDVPIGASFKVLGVRLSRELGRRLADRGFTEGAEGALVRAGFMRGPLQVRIRGYDLLIRREEAAGIEVEPLGDWSALLDARPGLHGLGRGRHHGAGGAFLGGGRRAGAWRRGRPWAARDAEASNPDCMRGCSDTGEAEGEAQ